MRPLPGAETALSFPWCLFFIKIKGIIPYAMILCTYMRTQSGRPWVRPGALASRLSPALFSRRCVRLKTKREQSLFEEVAPRLRNVSPLDRGAATSVELFSRSSAKRQTLWLPLYFRSLLLVIRCCCQWFLLGFCSAFCCFNLWATLWPGVWLIAYYTQVSVFVRLHVRHHLASSSLQLINKGFNLTH